MVIRVIGKFGNIKMLVIVSLISLILIGTGSAQTFDSKKVANNRPDSLRIVYGGGLRGSIEPCG